MTFRPDVQEWASRGRHRAPPPKRVITMRKHQGQSVRLRRRRVETSTRLARRHWAARIRPAPRSSSSTFLRPLAPGPLRPFVAVMDALTPTRSVAAVLGLFPATPRSAPREQVSLIHALDLPAIPSPTTCGCSASPRHVTHWRVEPRLLPSSGNSGLRLSLAGSPLLTGRIEFVILRTGRSPPAALHPVSQRRSCSRLRVNVYPERTFTSPTKRALRRTSVRSLPPGKIPVNALPDRPLKRVDCMPPLGGSRCVTITAPDIIF
jgi:hypothetical protein